jgi:isoleucyl-tRNA synthetase
MNGIALRRLMTDLPDYKSTVFLPQTDFPMKAGLAQKEPALAAKWDAEDLYGQLRRARAGRERFILHDGPPYANGDIHMGHAMNKVLKDIIVRAQSLMGKDAPYVPGWDCHGLPIEWKIEEEYRKKKLNKDEVPAQEFRAQCRAYADKWVGVQKEQFKRLGVMGDWDDPYLTMKFEAEAAIVAELLKFAETGQLYRGAKPVMWSPVEKTALAEAEVEYEDVTSTQIDVAFEIVEAPNAPELEGAYAVIWTTTPWTIPTNQAIAYGEELTYLHVEIGGRRYLVAEPLLADFQFRLNDPKLDEELLPRVPEGIDESRIKIKGSDLAGVIAQHPMHHLGGFYAKPRPFLPADFVTTDTGTGLVHLAPDHGEDDFLLCKAHGIDPVFVVESDGKYRADWIWLGGQGSVINDKFNSKEGPILGDLASVGALPTQPRPFRHSYPHSWRSKARIIYRCTPQWFIAMDRPTVDSAIPRCAEEEKIKAAQGNGATLRDLALNAIGQTRWVPERSTNRIRSMVEGRPDWVISRQRAWGVPIALYVDRQTGEYLNDPAVNARIIEAFKAGGADAWFGADHQALLGELHPLSCYEVVTDILDVWFDSGSTHSFVVEQRYGAGVRADLYLEGSDQHRGWFQSSLLESAGTRGVAPYKAVLTHGFALDGQGRKMSKSLGNVVDPLKIMGESGADILRMWVASTDYFDDVRIGKEVLAGSSDAYRKLRNTFRYLLGALADFTKEEKVPVSQMPELERYMLHRLAELDAELREVVADRTSESWLEFGHYTRALNDFANIDLSAFFFDIRKDCLYCDVNPATGAQTEKRRAYRTVLDTLFHALVRYAAPIIPFTAEEIWGSRFPEAGSVHLLEWPALSILDDADYFDNPTLVHGAFRKKWDIIRGVRETILKEIEPMRREKKLGSSLEAVVSYPFESLGVSAENLAEICIVSEVNSSVLGGVTKTTHHKCGRCWRHLPDVADDGALCGRCEDVLSK